ncbi:MAG: HAMP domain-containing histidine kinase [Bacteroidales bacterium]|nr:HAMP domain-containing histidine kinase [Bacteroidales bacterium]
MIISNFTKWISSFFSSLGNGISESQNELDEDFTYKKLLEKVEKLEQLMTEESTKTERLKRSFLNNIYHEIRTPMNSIVGFTELLKQNGLSEYKKELYVNKIRQSSEDFLRLIDLLLDASLIESGNLELKNKPFCLEQMVDELHSYYTIQKHILDKSDIALLKNKDHYYPELHIRSDQDCLYKILSNLLDNAFKFTHKGVIEFGFKVLSPTQIMFFVKDSGIGIDLTQAAELFQKFSKTDYYTGRDNRGLGLGLSIAKGLTDLMGGKIWVESNHFGGSTFKFTIPFEMVHITGQKDTDTEKQRLTKMLYMLL